MSNTVFIHKLPASAMPWAFAIEFDYNADFIDALKAEIPGRCRRYHPTTKMWVFKANVIEVVTELARIHVGRYVHVEPLEPEPTVDAYSELHLLPTAPLELVKAAYRIESKRHHPDHGGDKARMQAINSAYQVIVRGIA